MLIPASVDSESSFILFVGDTISDFGSKHHLIAAHIVIHHIFKRRQEGQLVDEIEIYQFVCSYLYADIAFDVEDGTTSLDCMEQLPTLDTRHSVNTLFEEENVA